MLNYPYIMPLVAEGGGVSSQLFKDLVDGSITSITAEDLSGITSIRDYAFYNVSSLVSIVIPESVSTINTAAFSNCTSLSNVELPDSLITIAANVFSQCSALKNISIPDSITQLQYRAFQRSGLENITLSDNITYLGSEAFQYCSALKYVIIGNGLTTIGDRAFQHCTSLSFIALNKDIPPAISNTTPFEDTNDCPIYVPTPDDYRIATNWADVVDANNQSRIFPLVEAETDLQEIDTNTYTKACVIEKAYKQYEYDGSQWNEVID